MTNTIEALWNGELSFCEHCGARDPEANRLVGLMAKSRDGLWDGLSEAQRDLFQAYIDQSEDYLGRMMGMAFRDGFCVGVQLMAEGLREG